MATSTIKMTPNVYITESGTNGIWKYHKYSDRTYHAWIVSTINLGAGTAWAGGYFHKTYSALTPPTFSNSVTSFYGAANGSVLAVFCGYANDYSTYWLNGAASALDGLRVRLDMYGTW